jgi:hypothetical protein
MVHAILYCEIHYGQRERRIARLSLLFSRGSPLRSDKIVPTFQSRISAAFRQDRADFSAEDLRCSPTSLSLFFSRGSLLLSDKPCLNPYRDTGNL